MRLARDHASFVRRLARERTPLERRFFVVVTADVPAPSAQPGVRALLRSHARARRASDEMAARTLALRCEELTQALAALGLHARRLAGDELLVLWRDVIAGSARPSGSATSREEVRRGA